MERALGREEEQKEEEEEEEEEKKEKEEQEQPEVLRPRRPSRAGSTRFLDLRPTGPQAVSPCDLRISLQKSYGHAPRN